MTDADALLPLAERYVVLVLSVGRHDPDYVDAFYGPPALKEEAERRAMGLGEILAGARSTLGALGRAAPAGGGEMERLRHRYLTRQLESLVSRVEILQGRALGFDEESEALYDARAPVYPETFFQGILEEMRAALPGTGPVPDRLNAFRRDFIIPPATLDAVFQAAVRESRERTLRHIALPAEESFRIEYVTGKSWSGYNWYQGGCRSLIQINTELPIYIDRAIDLASHEGYPGHHVYNALLETELVRKRGWVEFTVYALFSPQSLIAEGTANFGIDVAYSPADRLEFERSVLFPLAGLDPGRAADYARVHALTQRLSYAGNEAARSYLNGEFSKEQAAAWLVNYALMPPERAIQRVRFFHQYRSYVINYNLGLDLVRFYIAARSGSPPDPEARWREFARLLSSPRLPSGLKEEPIPPPRQRA